MIKQIVVCIVITLSSTCDTNGCCFPPTYEGYQDIAQLRVKDGQSSLVTGTIHYWHDNVSQRSAYIESLVVNGVKTQIHIIKDYNVTNTVYTITKNGCTRKSAVGLYPKGCITDNSQVEQQKYYGKQGSQNMLNVRTFDFGSGSADYTRLTVDQTNCFPISEVHITTGNSRPSVDYTVFYNFTEGISDYTVFDIPKVCQIPVVGK